MIMRKCLAIGLLFCALCALAGCSDEEVVTQFNGVLQAAGEKVLTSEADLQGTRTFGEDGYVGTYQAQYDGFTGEETVFGGTALERDAGNEVTLSCTLTLAEGTAQVLFQSGGPSAGSALRHSGIPFGDPLPSLRRQLYHRAGRKCDRFHPTNGGIKVGIPFGVSLF